MPRKCCPTRFSPGCSPCPCRFPTPSLRRWGDERGIPGIALFFTMYAVIALFIRPMSGRILDKYGLPVLMYPSFIFAALTFGLIGAAQGITLIIIAGVCRALSTGVALPSIQGMSIKRLGSHRAGVSSATIYMGMDLMNTIGPAAGGVIATHMGYANMFYIFAGVVLLGMPLYVLLRRYEKRKELEDALERPEAQSETVSNV